MKKKQSSAKTSEPSDEPLLSAKEILRPEILFHYCTKDAFEGILSNHCMWLSDAAHMNDTMEGQWMDNIIDRWRQNYKEQWWQEAGHIYEDYKLFKSTFYINCFSESGDLLSQWRGYADDGKGVSIGFSMQPSFLSGNLTLSKIFRMEGLGGHLEKVVYDEQEQKEILRKIFHFTDYWAKESINNPNISMYFYDAIIDSGRDCMSYASRLIKHRGFAEEQEWRIIYDGQADLSTSGIDKTRQTRIRENTKINFHTWKFPTTIIKEIILGPKCPMTIEEVKNKLSDWKYDNVIVKKSEIPYR